MRRIPLVDENGQLAGIVTLDDLIATIGEQLDNISDTIEAQSPEYRPSAGQFPHNPHRESNIFN